MYFALSTPPCQSIGTYRCSRGVGQWDSKPFGQIALLLDHGKDAFGLGVDTLRAGGRLSITFDLHRCQSDDREQQGRLLEYDSDG